MNVTEGQMVTYKHLHRGGYGYETSHPAVVVKIHGKRATIRVARIDRSTNTTHPHETVVNLTRLRPRLQACGVEHVLTAAYPEAKSQPLVIREGKS